jgi:hypothetical protein
LEGNRRVGKVAEDDVSWKVRDRDWEKVGEIREVGNRKLTGRDGGRDKRDGKWEDGR